MIVTFKCSRKIQASNTTSKRAKNVSFLMKATLELSKHSTLHLHASITWLQHRIHICFQELAIKSPPLIFHYLHSNLFKETYIFRHDLFSRNYFLKKLINFFFNYNPEIIFYCLICK